MNAEAKAETGCPDRRTGCSDTVTDNIGIMLKEFVR